MIYNNNYALGGGCNGLMKIREEDCYQSGIDCIYPGQDPITNSYLWNNINSNENKIVCMLEYDDETANMIEEDRDDWTLGGENPGNFFYDVASNRPGTCSDNDSYWETDTKKLYRCEGPNNWVFIYKPYTYPHPLIKPANPRNLKITY